MVSLATRGVRKWMMAVGMVGALTLPACSSSEEGKSAPSNNTPVDVPPDLSPMGGDRPIVPYVPESYRSSVPVPLVILLHGYGASGVLQELLFQYKLLSEEKGFVYLNPEGNFDASGKRFWNAFDACCNFYGSSVDDVGYIMSLVTEAKKRFAIDPARVFVIGHSNGGYMTHRMACDHPEVFASAVSLAGSIDPAKCNPSEPISVLQVHGTEDKDVVFTGGSTKGAAYPGAVSTVEVWAKHNGCSLAPDTSSPARDLSPDISGAETKVSKYTGCKPGGDVELWTMEGEGHVPAVAYGLGAAMLDFLYQHPKPAR
jgi:polyhydroxybutyrate depolymerase